MLLRTGVSGEEIKSVLKHVAHRFDKQADRIKEAQGSSWEIHSSTAAERQDGTSFHNAYAVLISEDEDLVKDFMANYRAWMKVKGLDKKHSP